MSETLLPFQMRAYVWTRHHVRRVAYSIPFIRQRIGHLAPPPEDNAVLWDHLLSETETRAAVAGTISIDWRNAAIATAIRHYAEPTPAVLDIGCAGGTLATVLPPFVKYLGVDVSPYVIDLARASVNGENIDFVTSDIRTLDIAADTWDVMVLAEFLYFLSVEDAAKQVKRVATGLRPNGIVIISMKDEGGKSRAIFKALSPTFEWVDGILWQAKVNGADYRMRPNRERPPFLVGVLKPRGMSDQRM